MLRKFYGVATCRQGESTFVMEFTARKREPPKQYDAETCITAGELRKMEIGIPEAIPDDAWVPRSEVLFGDVKLDAAGTEIRIQGVCSVVGKWRVR